MTKQLELWIGNAKAVISELDQEIGIKQIAKGYDKQDLVSDMHHLTNLMKWRKCEGHAARDAKKTLIRVALVLNLTPAEVNNRGRLIATIAKIAENTK